MGDGECSHQDPACSGRKAQLLPILGEVPQRRCGLCYGGDPTDVVLNSAVLILVLIALLLSSTLQPGESLSSRLFFLPFGLFCVVIQWLVAAVTDAEGFSLIWASMLGLLTHTHLEFAVHQLQPTAPHPASAVVAGVAAMGGITVMVYYSIATDILSTVAHLLAAGCGFGVGALEFWSSAGAYAMVAAVTVFALLRAALAIARERLRAVGAACNTPLRPHAAQVPSPPQLSAIDLAVASLQAQLLRTRDECSRLQHQMSALSADASESEMKERLDALRRREATLLQRVAEKQKEAASGGSPKLVVAAAPEAAPTCRVTHGPALPSPKGRGHRRHPSVRTAVHV